MLQTLQQQQQQECLLQLPLQGQVHPHLEPWQWHLAKGTGVAGSLPVVAAEQCW